MHWSQRLALLLLQLVRALHAHASVLELLARHHLRETKSRVKERLCGNGNADDSSFEYGEVYFVSLECVAPAARLLGNTVRLLAMILVLQEGISDVRSGDIPIDTSDHDGEECNKDAQAEQLESESATVSF